MSTEEIKDTEEKLPMGAFASSLTRKNSQIRRDRAIAIAEDAELIYRRTVENISIELKRLEREQENALDMSPENITTLKLASDFDPDKFAERDMEFAIKIRNTKIKLELATERYAYLFGGK
jgi:hypothetical protein